MRPCPRQLRQRAPRLLDGLLLGGLLLALGCGCASPLGPSRTFSYFELPDPRDPWSPKIAGWQSRERAGPDLDALRAPAPVSDPGAELPREGAQESDLRAKYFSFRSERKRSLAREFAAWIQSQARDHYRPDGPIDHWATLEETLESGGDDCDGLELLTYHYLLDMGFPDDEVYRAIVVRPEDGQHHMVTLWFERPSDPWVIDPTGAMIEGMPRMSEVPGWVPLKVFSEEEEFTVRDRPELPARLARSVADPRAPVDPR